MSIEWKIVITMRYCNKSKTQILVCNDLVRLIRIVNHSMLRRRGGEIGSPIRKCELKKSI